MKISASLVLFHNSLSMVRTAIDCFLASGVDGPLIIIDNSLYPLFPDAFASEKIVYRHLGRNIGFGAGHNEALGSVGPASEFHLILNPDVSFGPETLGRLHAVMQTDPSIGACMPRVSFADGSLQRLCKLLPTPWDLILRRFIPSRALRDALNARYELHDLAQDRISDIPSLSGCFLLVRTRLLRQLHGFDTRYFMYMEDVDLVRRVGDLARTVYVPSVQIMHEYSRGSYRQRKLLRFHMVSAVKYFFKWGWIFDPVRSRRNATALAAVREPTLESTHEKES